jgi:hypothetical protein
MSRFCAGKNEIVSHDKRCLPLSLFCLSLLGLCKEISYYKSAGVGY